MNRIFSRLFLIGVYAFMYLPVLVLVLLSFSPSGSSFAWSGWTLKWYERFFSSPEIFSAFWSSLVIASTSTFLSIGFGLLVVVASRWWQTWWLFYLFYPSVVLPEIVIAVGLLSFFMITGAPIGYNSVIAGHTLLGLGIAIPLIRSRFVEIDPLLTEASLDLGATYFQTFYKIHMPLLAPTLLGAAFLVFTISMDDFFISFFCAGSTIETISVFVYAQMRSAIDPAVSALSACLLLLSALLAWVLVKAKVMERVIAHG